MAYLESSDGTVDILCRLCGDKICTTVYAGFSTAICDRCHREDPSEESKPLEVLEAEGKVPEGTTKSFMESITERVLNIADTVLTKVDEVILKRIDDAIEGSDFKKLKTVRKKRSTDKPKLTLKRKM